MRQKSVSRLTAHPRRSSGAPGGGNFHVFDSIVSALKAAGAGCEAACLPGEPIDAGSNGLDELS